MRFLIDNQLPSALAVWLKEHGHEAQHVLDVGLAQSKDNSIWQHAQATRAVIVTKDEDFAEWIRRGRVGPQVVWLRFGNTRKKELRTWLEPLLQAIVRELEAGIPLIEIR